MNSDIDRLYLKGGRGLISVKLAIEFEQRNLSFYVHQSDDPYLRIAATNYLSYAEHGKQYKLSYYMECLQTWKDKPLHEQFLREIEEQICVKSQWLWLQHGNLTKEIAIEGLVLAAQEQALSTNVIRTHIFNIQSSAKCQLCSTNG